MSFPNPNYYGIVENPLVFTPFAETGDEPENAPSALDFNLLTGMPFILLDGQNLLLL